MAHTHSPSSASKKPYDLRGFRIMIAEDYPFMADLMASMLREFGVGHILLAGSGNEAKENIMLFNGSVRGGNLIDVLLVDWLMPDGDGIDLMNWVRGHSSDSIRFMPMILCSAYASEKVVTTARDHGANEAMVKPISATMLAQRILHVIDYPRPFVKVPGFFGPDRRRRDMAFKGEDRRKINADHVKEHHERL